MRKYLISSLGAVILWSMGIIFIKYLSKYFTVSMQNFLRYLSAALFLLIISLLLGKFNINFIKRNFRYIFLAASTVFLYQTISINGVYLISTTIATILMKLNVFFTSIMAYIVYSDERELILSKRFLIGLFLAFFGTMGIATDGFNIGNLSFSNQDFIGYILIILGAFFWSLYTIIMKKIVANVDKLFLTAIIFIFSSPMFIPLVFFEEYFLQDIGFEIFLVLILSGVLSVGLGNALNYISIEGLGASIASVIQLLTPFFTGIFSYIFLGERISLADMFFGIMVIIGCSIILYRFNR